MGSRRTTTIFFIIVGLAVIIDVFRAFTTAAVVMANGAECIVPVGGLEEAFELRRLHPDWVLMGERGGRRVVLGVGPEGWLVARLSGMGLLRPMVQITRRLLRPVQRVGGARE